VFNDVPDNNLKSSRNAKSNNIIGNINGYDKNTANIPKPYTPNPLPIANNKENVNIYSNRYNKNPFSDNKTDKNVSNS